MRVIATALAVFVVILSMLGLLPNVLEIPFVILFGWIPASKRLAGNLPFSAGELGLFLGGSVLLILGLHWFLQQRKPWRFRWTVALSGGGALVLLALMSLVGVTHQLGWILISKEPVFTRVGKGFGERAGLMHVATAIADIARTNSMKGLQAVLYDGRLPKMRDGTPPWEKYNVLFVEPTNGYFAVVWLRDPSLHRRIGAACMSSNGIGLKKDTGF
jgi:hypothetical protein